METKILILALLAASLLSSVAAINVPVFAGGDKHDDNDDDDGNGIKAKNDDGQQAIAVNECSNTQEDFENSNNNVQNLNCEILINNLQDVQDTTNIIDNDETPDGPADGGAGGEFGEQCVECFAVLDVQELALVLDVLALLQIADLEELCELIDAGTVTLAQLEVILGDAGILEADITAIIDCIAELLVAV